VPSKEIIAHENRALHETKSLGDNLRRVGARQRDRNENQDLDQPSEEQRFHCSSGSWPLFPQR
jgi:hypothetical protein